MSQTERVQPSRQLRETGVMAILRAPSAARFVDVCQALAEAGITCLEITLTAPDALGALRAVREKLPASVDVGAGTVLDAKQARAAIDAGAGFLVSPSVALDVVATAAAAGVPAYPGALTPTEVLTAWQAGASAVKLFPASAVGTGYVKQLAGPFPDIPIVPTGGVSLDSIGAWIDAGVIAVGLGGPLLGEVAAGGDLDAVAERAKRALAAVQEARGSGT